MLNSWGPWIPSFLCACLAFDYLTEGFNFCKLTTRRILDRFTKSSMYANRRPHSCFVCLFMCTPGLKSDCRCHRDLFWSPRIRPDVKGFPQSHHPPQLPESNVLLPAVSCVCHTNNRNTFAPVSMSLVSSCSCICHVICCLLISSPIPVPFSHPRPPPATPTKQASPDAMHFMSCCWLRRQRLEGSLLEQLSHGKNFK